MILSSAVEKFEGELAARRSPATMTTYRSTLRSFVSYVGMQADCGSISWRTIVDYVETILKRGYRPSTASLYSVALHQFIAFLIRTDLVVWTQADTLKAEDALSQLRLHPGHRLPRIPDQADVEKVIQTAASSPLPSPFMERNLALVEVLASTGCRIGEVARLRVGDINRQKREAIVLGKRDKERKVFFSPSAVNACIRYWKARKNVAPDAPAFARHDDGAGKVIKPMSTRAMRQVVDDLAAVAGVENLTPHKFRHAFATRMLEETSDLAMVQDALGHESPETTRVYAHVNPENIRRARQEIWRK